MLKCNCLLPKIRTVQVVEHTIRTGREWQLEVTAKCVECGDTSTKSFSTTDYGTLRFFRALALSVGGE